MDISKFFDTINHELLMRAVKLHVTGKWILLYMVIELVVTERSRSAEILSVG